MHVSNKRVHSDTDTDPSKYVYNTYKNIRLVSFVELGAVSASVSVSFAFYLFHILALIFTHGICLGCSFLSHSFAQPVFRHRCVLLFDDNDTQCSVAIVYMPHICIRLEHTISKQAFDWLYFFLFTFFFIYFMYKNIYTPCIMWSEIIDEHEHEIDETKNSIDWTNAREKNTRTSNLKSMFFWRVLIFSVHAANKTLNKWNPPFLVVALFLNTVFLHCFYSMH